MCGVVGIAGSQPVNQLLYDALLMLQHRGQDAAGIATLDAQHTFRLRTGKGLVAEVFDSGQMTYLQGNIGIGHVRYPTSGTSSAAEAQPLYVNSPYGVVLVHNGNLTNTTEVTSQLVQQAYRHLNTASDSEVLLNSFAEALYHCRGAGTKVEAIFSAIRRVHQQVRGAYACVAVVSEQGLVAFRDPHGIRPLVLGQCEQRGGGMAYMVASESVALSAVGFKLLRDVAPGEAIVVTQQGELFSQQCADQPHLSPCLFEFVYFARPDSFIDGISVYQARMNMGYQLAAKIVRTWPTLAIDVVIPVPETACDPAMAIAEVLKRPYRQGFVKNRYIGRTFIMADQASRQQSVRRKLNTIGEVFRGKTVLLVDDSIVRGTTSQQIVSLAREAGAQRVYFASLAPQVQFPNVYGIDIPGIKALVAHGRDVDSINSLLGADGLIFQELADLVAAVRQENSAIQGFEASLFNGDYITGDVDSAYLTQLNQQRQEQISGWI
jgi:amidophosphoribosyltransferase